jgi:hypothetical protein
MKKAYFKAIEEQHKRIMAKTFICSENGKKCKIVDMSECTAISPWVDIEFKDGSGTYCIQLDKLVETK